MYSGDTVFEHFVSYSTSSEFVFILGADKMLFMEFSWVDLMLLFEFNDSGLERIELDIVGVILALYI